MAVTHEVGEDCCYMTGVAAVGTEAMCSGRVILAAAGMTAEERPELEVGSSSADTLEELVETTTVDNGSDLRTAADSNQAAAKIERMEDAADAAERSIVVEAPCSTARDVVGSLHAEIALVGDEVRSGSSGPHVLAEPE